MGETPEYDIVFVGGGFSLFTLLVESLRQNKIFELLKSNRTLILERTKSFGVGHFESAVGFATGVGFDYISLLFRESNHTLKSILLELFVRENKLSENQRLVLREQLHNSCLAPFREMLNAEVFRVLTTYFDKAPPALLVGHFLRAAGNLLLKFVHQLGDRKVFKPLAEVISVQSLLNGDMLVGYKNRLDEEVAKEEAKLTPHETFALRKSLDSVTKRHVMTSFQRLRTRKLIFASGLMELQSALPSLRLENLPRERTLAIDVALSIHGFHEWTQRLEALPIGERKVVLVGPLADTSPILTLLLDPETYSQEWPPDFIPLKNKKNCKDCCRCGRAALSEPKSLPPLPNKNLRHSQTLSQTETYRTSPERDESSLKMSSLNTSPKPKHLKYDARVALGLKRKEKQDGVVTCSCECLCFGTLKSQLRVPCFPAVPLLEYNSIQLIVPKSSIPRKGRQQTNNINTELRVTELIASSLARHDRRVQLIEVRSYDEIVDHLTPKSAIFYPSKWEAVFPLIRDSTGTVLSFARTGRSVHVDSDLRLKSTVGDSHPQIFAFGSCASFAPPGTSSDDDILAPQTRRMAAILLDTLLVTRKRGIPVPRDIWQSEETVLPNFTSKLPSLSHAISLYPDDEATPVVGRPTRRPTN
eukprot:TRINITY_DN2718_c0_g1_i5.p1 TRINITY_DN2718_c0_g1~~TRINITY_DN2718_c0_g1_i5.p1  ORF type:complete len:644 (+),score=35.98 TRINITY_DN2718_c0_g1_i5:97-2028(+)